MSGLRLATIKTPVEQLALVAACPNADVDRQCELLFGKTELSIMQADMDAARPGRNDGVVICGVLVGMSVSKKNDKNVMHCKLILTDDITVAIEYADAKAAELRGSISRIDQRRTWIRVDTDYRMSEEDRVHVSRQIAPALLGDTRKNGYIPVGMIRINTGDVLSIALYGVTEVRTLQGDDAQLGAYVKITNFNVHVDRDMKNPVTRGETISVLKSDHCLKRLQDAFEKADSVPILSMTDSDLGFMKWPADVIVSTKEMPAYLCNPAHVDYASRESHPLWVKPMARIYIANQSTFVLHIGETEAQTRARMRIANGRSTPTAAKFVLPSAAKDAFVFEDAKNQKYVRAQYAVIVDQLHPNTSAPSRTVISATTVKGPPIETLTTSKKPAGQLAVVRAIVAQLRGSVILDDVSVTKQHEFEAPDMADAVTLTAWINCMSPDVLPLTIPRAGFRVSHSFMHIHRATCIDTDYLSKRETECAYTVAFGQPTRFSALIPISTTKWGMFDEATSERICEFNDTNKVVTERKAHATDLEAKGLLTGLMKSIENTHAVFFVGKFVASADVVEHQATLAQNDLAALLAGNESMISTGVAPIGWPPCYTNMIQVVEKTASDYSYAVHNDYVSGKAECEMLKRHLEGLDARTPKRALEAAADSSSSRKAIAATPTSVVTEVD